MKYIEKPDGSLKESVVSVDNQCAFGQWLHGDGKKFAADPIYQKILVDHAEFHKVAGKIVAAINRGEHIDQEQTFGNSSAFQIISVKVVLGLRKLRDGAGKSGA